MPGTGTDSVTESRQQAQLEGISQRDAGAIPPQVTTNEAVNPTPTMPLPDTTRDDEEALGQEDNYEALGISVSDSRPPSETMMNTRINAGGATEAPAGTQHGHQPEEEGDVRESGPTAPQSSSHFTPWLPSSAPRIYASPLAYPMMAPPLPAGFQAYAPVIAAPQPLPTSTVIPPIRAASPPSSTRYIPHLRDAGPLPQGFQTYIPFAPAPRQLPGPYTKNPFAPRSVPLGHRDYEGVSYAQSPHVTHSAPQEHGGYANQESSYYPARGPIGRRREVYVSHDPFQKWSQPKAKPTRVAYNPYAPADGIDGNAGPFTTLPTPYYASESLPHTRNAEYPVRLPPAWYQQPHRSSHKRPTYDSNTPYAPMSYSPRRAPHPLAAFPYERRATHDSQRSNDQLYIPEIIPSGRQGPDILPVQHSGDVFIPPESEEDLVTAGPSGHLEPSPPPSPRSPRSSERRSYSPTSPTYSAHSRSSSRSSRAYSPASPAYSPASAVLPRLPGDANLAPPHSVSAASSSVVSLESASPAASSVPSAGSPRNPTHAPSHEDPMSLSSKRSYSFDNSSRFPLSDGPVIPARVDTPERRPTLISNYSSDVEKLESRPHRSSRRGIGRMIPAPLQALGRLVWRWAMPPRRKHHTSSRPELYTQDEEHSYTSSSDEKSSFMATVIEFTTRRFPTDLYLVFLLFLPSFYFSRVARLFEEAELAMPEIEQMAIRTSLQAQNFLDEQVPDGEDVFPLQWIRLKSTWEHFIDSLVREWKTLNVISALLLSAILTILQIDDAANDYLTRYTALLSFICSLVSLLFGCIYIIRFATMRKTYKAAEWAMEAQESGTSTWWNVFILLALPSIWLTWSILLYIVCIMSYIWRTAPNVQESPPPLSDLTVLKIRIGITILLGLALVYACFILATFRRYGRAMDMKWAARIDNWRLGSTYSSGGPPAGATWYPYASYPGGSVYRSVPRDIDRDRRSVEKPQVRFRDRESDVPRMSVPSDSPATVPHPRGERHGNIPTVPRERGTGSYDIYQSDFSGRQPDPEAGPVSSTQADILPPLGPTDWFSGRLSQTLYLSRPSDLPLRRSPESFRPSVRDKSPSVTSSSSVSLQRYGSPSSQLADIVPSSGRVASIVEDQRVISPTQEHAKSSSHDVIAAQPLLSEAPDGHAPQTTHISKQVTPTVSSTHSPLHLGDTQDM